VSVRACLIAVLVFVVAGCAGGAWKTQSGTASPGRTKDGSYHSRALAATVHYAVYLPAGYDESSKRYPVIYFLHGLPGNAKSHGDIGFITRPIEESGMPAIVVGAQGARGGDTDPEWHDWGPGRNWETATARELVSVIDRRYRTIASRKARALIGISAGGYGAALIAIHHPSVYSVIESWSGYFHPTNPAGTAPMDMGSKEANDWANAHTLVPKLKRIFAGYRYRPTYYGFYVGSDDKHFLRENRKFAKELTAAGVKHYYAEYAGGHNQSFWKEHEEDWVTAALRKLERPH
jgi:enterochelin esterase-like enzyme